MQFSLSDQEEDRESITAYSGTARRAVLPAELANGMVRRWAYCGADVYSPEEEASDGNTHDRN